MSEDQIREKIIEDISNIIHAVGDEKIILKYLNTSELDNILFYLKRDYDIE